LHPFWRTSGRLGVPANGTTTPNLPRYSGAAITGPITKSGAAVQ